MNMIKFLIIINLVIVTLTGCNNSNDDAKKQNINIQKMEATVEENTNNTSDFKNKEEPVKEIEEKELYSFSTTILAKEENRVSNIKLACNTINGTIVNPGGEFSFWKVIGNPTTEKGYKEAKAFTAKGGVTTAIGGGLCQVSSTIYDVALNVPDIETIERHQHTREVYYVELGYDASVSYGSADFRFKNNFPNSIKIYADATNESVNIRFVKLV